MSKAAALQQLLAVSLTLRNCKSSMNQHVCQTPTATTLQLHI
jgi:hypothetical protein